MVPMVPILSVADVTVWLADLAGWTGSGDGW